MARVNDEVAEILQEYADLVAITGGEAYKVRAYEKATRAVAGHHADLASMDAAELRTIPNVGKALAEKIAAYLSTGSIPQVEKLRDQIPDGVRRLTAIPTLGPKKALLLYQELQVSSVEELAAAIDAGRLRDLKGFGEKTEENIRHGIASLESTGERVKIDVAMEQAEDVVARLAEVPGCEKCAYAGSLRRMRETIGDVDILAAAHGSTALMDAFCELPQVREVIARGETKTSIRTTAGLQMDLRVVPPVAWGAAMQYFTGSKAHNIRTREMAVRAKLRLSEYGLFDTETDERIVSATEAEVYERLGLPWIPPALREDRGEIEAALAGELPTPVTEADLRGDLHTHTDLTDGVSSLETMVATAAERGYEYVAVTDHAPNLVMQRMTDEKILAQREQLARLADSYPGMTLLHGTELNIDPDGEVDWPGDFLAGFDVCVASVHSHFTQDEQAMTRRIVRACENPYVNVIGHPTGRKLGKRPGVEVDLDAVFEACARTGTALEVNAHPDRLDLRDDHIMRAKRYGVKFAIDSDSHATNHMALIRYGVGSAQRGWLTPDDVVNTWPLDRLRAFLRKDR
ncbi:MAG: DNA polymerase/3'-5' exonuclease PolX [Streptosporangiales bacterium]|nr:DNA polymerase/3'-5' exonuclease PolX [Streptosporangiales bacterium]